MPPLEMRQMVGPTDPASFHNPSGEPIYARYGVSLGAYESVFDFGCGCGRMARQLLLQTPRPRRYIGIDVHKGMVAWCTQNLSPIDPRFQFLHHDVYSPSYAPGNSMQLAQPFPVTDGEFSLVIAHSVFTHLFRRQTAYYLREVARILKPEGVAVTSWFFFDRDSFPFLTEGPFCLYVGEINPTEAVLYDRVWFIRLVRRLGLRVQSTTPPGVAGHQWTVLLARREAASLDAFPLGEDGAEWLCGATSKAMAASLWPPEVKQQAKVASADSSADCGWPAPPPLFGVLAELDAARRGLEEVKRCLALSSDSGVPAVASGVSSQPIEESAAVQPSNRAQHVEGLGETLAAIRHALDTRAIGLEIELRDLSARLLSLKTALDATTHIEAHAGHARRSLLPHARDFARSLLAEQGRDCELERSTAERDAALQLIYRSRSWRLTAPMRAVATHLRQLRPRVRATLAPARHRFQRATSRFRSLITRSGCNWYGRRE